MNFIKAIQHATIGYGIRRKEWLPDCILHLEGDGLYWITANATTGERAVIGGDTASDLTAADLMATDWEVI